MSYLPNGAIVLPAGEGRPIPGDGLLIPNLLGKVTADHGSGSIAVMEGTAEPGFGPPLHIHHSSEELFYVLQGQMDFQIGDQRVSATPGTLVMVPRETVHAPRVVGRERARFLVMFAPAGPDGLFYEIAALAQENGGVINDNDSRIEALAVKYDTEHVGPPLQ
ncbi:cupin domain-containing protein [Nonomuraea sp. NPDC050680]|uniref:cupin domain-containing protein n=1 Tax=Nonomuraea sp. NPDC050680 TaxID=3154630 RepID=UPI0033EC40F0